MTSPDLQQMITELTQTHTVEAKYTAYKNGTLITQNHKTKAKSLIWQLSNSDVTSTAVEGDTTKAFGSKPVGRLDAIDHLAHIDLVVNRWTTDLGETAPLPTTKALLRLHGLSASMDPPALHELTRDIRRLWTAARILTGWDTPAWSPDATCPNCEERRTLRLRLTDHLGLCTNCRTIWDETTIGLLADHVRTESQQPHRPQPDTTCWCPWPMPLNITDLAYTCPRCASPRCRHALIARIDATIRQTEHGDSVRPQA